MGNAGEGARRRMVTTTATVTAFLRRCITLAALAVVVLGFGLVVSGQEAEAPSFTVQAQHTAAQAARELAEDAERLASDDGSSLPSGTVDLLRRHAELLSVPAAESKEQTGNPPSPEASAARTSPEDFAAALRQSATANLEAAEEADPGIARLLASTGTAQWILAGEITGPTSALPGESISGDFPSAAAVDPDCSSNNDSSNPQASGLRALRQAEIRAAYAYEVAASRGVATGAEDRAQMHRRAAGELASFLTAQCAQVLQPVDAYELDSRFWKDPDASLKTLESELVVSYADLVGLSDGVPRTWAIDRLVTAAVALHQPGILDVTPGMDLPGQPAGGRP